MIIEMRTYTLQPGNHVIELKPAGTDKGTAVGRLMRDAPFAGRAPWVLGDDLTDEHAFAVANALGLTPVVSGDTAGAAREVAEAQDPTQAAIAPPLAAEIYGLEVLRSDVEDEDDNTTRFIVLSRDFEQAPRGEGHVVTSFVFNVRNLPAALYKALGGFATNGVNMTKLESYMVDGAFTGATQFLAEVDGHPDDLPLKRALEELAFFTTDVTLLGVYPADPFRAISS